MSGAKTVLTSGLTTSANPWSIGSNTAITGLTPAIICPNGPSADMMELIMIELPGRIQGC
jgi:hypothetical protein